MKLYQKLENTLPHLKNNLENEEVTNQLTNHNTDLSSLLRRKSVQNFTISCDIFENATKSTQKEFEASVHANSFKGNEIRKYRIYVNITDPFPKKNSESK